MSIFSLFLSLAQNLCPSSICTTVRVWKARKRPAPDIEAAPSGAATCCGAWRQVLLQALCPQAWRGSQMLGCRPQGPRQGPSCLTPQKEICPSLVPGAPDFTWEYTAKDYFSLRKFLLMLKGVVTGYRGEFSRPDSGPLQPHPRISGTQGRVLRAVTRLLWAVHPQPKGWGWGCSHTSWFYYSLNLSKEPSDNSLHSWHMTWALPELESSTFLFNRWRKREWAALSCTTQYFVSNSDQNEIRFNFDL